MAAPPDAGQYGVPYSLYELGYTNEPPVRGVVNPRLLVQGLANPLYGTPGQTAYTTTNPAQPTAQTPVASVPKSSSRGGAELNRDFLNEFYEKGNRFATWPGIQQVPAAASKFAGPTGPGSGPMPDWSIPDTPYQPDDLIRGTYERYRSQAEGLLNQQLDAISAQYLDRIAELQNELAGYKTGSEEINRAYGQYAKDANEVLAAAAAVDPAPLPASVVDERIGQDFDAFEGEMRTVFQQIAGNGNEALANQMAQEMRYMQDVMVDGVRGENLTVEQLHGLAGAQATALAHMAWKDDLYNAERSRFELDLQIKDAIAKKQEQIADVKDEMDSAIEEARKAAKDQFDVSPDELWSLAMGDFFRFNGLNDQEIMEAQGLFQYLLESSPTAQYQFDDFKTGLARALNEDNLNRIGVMPQIYQFQEWLNSQIESLDPSDEAQAAELQAYMRTFQGLDNALSLPATADVVRRIKNVMTINGFGEQVSGWNLNNVDWTQMQSLDDPQWSLMLDLWSHHRDFRDNYSDYIQPTATDLSGYTGSGPAPNNYANRNHPDYVYRREVVAPHFASIIENMFKGAEIGALGYLRDPDDVGNGRVANSDHMSGGAIDVYYKHGTPEESDAMLTRIAQWARTVPGISSVVYEQNSAHRKPGSTEGHVHISFEIGHRVGADSVIPQGYPSTSTSSSSSSSSGSSQTAPKPL